MKEILYFLLFFLLTACFNFNPVLPESKLQVINSTKVMELAAERYQANEYNEALYYYTYAVKTFTNEIEVLAWANYEIGFIKYQQNKREEAIKYFDEVLKINSPNPAPTILAAQMKERLQKQLKKRK